MKKNEIWARKILRMNEDWNKNERKRESERFKNIVERLFFEPKSLRKRFQDKRKRKRKKKKKMKQRKIQLNFIYIFLRETFCMTSGNVCACECKANFGWRLFVIKKKKKWTKNEKKAHMKFENHGEMYYVHKMKTKDKKTYKYKCLMYCV